MKLADRLDLDSIVVESLSNLSGPLSGLDRILNRAYGLNDIKGRAQAIARLSAIVAYATLSREYEWEITKLQRKVKLQFEGKGRREVSEQQLSSSVIDRMKTKYRRLSAEINTLYETIPYTEIMGKSGQEANTILLSDGMKKLLILRQYLGIAVDQNTETYIRQFMETLGTIVKYAANVVKTEATLYTENGVLTGFVHHLEEERLSDLLNDISDNQTRLGSQFLEFSDNISQNQKNIDETITVKKTSIHLLTLADFNAGRGVGAKEGPKEFPYVSKKPTRVELLTPEYSLLGYVYCKVGQQPEDLLLRDTSDFLSLTDVSIHFPKEDFSYSIPYVAVNKGRILKILRQPAFLDG